MILAASFPAWQPHPEVWLLVAGVVALGVYAARVIGPKVVPEGEPVISRRQAMWFWSAVALLWVSSDWPIHDVSEDHLYVVHMGQHFLLTMVLPPLLLLATPRWLADLVVTDGGFVWTWLRRLTIPVVATVVFNAVTVFTHWGWVVNRSVEDGPFHYAVHVLAVTTAVLMWIPVCGPWRQLRMTSIPGTMIYLFMQTVVPTIPGGWLAVAGQPLYDGYDQGGQLFGLSAVADQQAAGVFMKIVTGAWLWLIIIVMFFRWAFDLARNERQTRVLTPEELADIDELRRQGDKPPASTGA